MSAPEKTGRLRLAHLHNTEQFQAVMNAGVVATSPHFALHRLNLDDATGALRPGPALFAPAPVWMGALLPKRHAKKAVRRNMLRRQIYSLGQELISSLAGGAHVVRLRRGFEAEGYVSASSTVLQKAVRVELSDLLARAIEKLSRPTRTASSL